MDLKNETLKSQYIEQIKVKMFYLEEDPPVFFVPWNTCGFPRKECENVHFR